MRSGAEITMTKVKSKTAGAKLQEAFYVGVHHCQKESTEDHTSELASPAARLYVAHVKRDGGRGGAGTAHPLSSHQTEFSAPAPAPASAPASAPAPRRR